MRQIKFMVYDLRGLGVWQGEMDFLIRNLKCFSIRRPWVPLKVKDEV